jgi:hypothetical protein
LINTVGPLPEISFTSAEKIDKNVAENLITE